MPTLRITTTPPNPPLTVRELLGTLYPAHELHTVLYVRRTNLTISLFCSCDRVFAFNEDDARGCGIRFKDALHAVRNTPTFAA